MVKDRLHYHTRELAAEKANKRIEEAFENKEVLKAPVVQILKGGLSVDVEGGRVFIPASLSIRHI